MKQTIQAIAEQVNAKELNFAKFRLAADEKNDTLIIIKGVKSLAIKYNYGMDLYVVTTYRKFIEVGKLDGVYEDKLQDIISEFFKFEYVMENFLNSIKKSRTEGE